MTRPNRRIQGARAVLAALLLACAMAPTGAQQKEPRVVARLKSLNGNVLVSRDTGLAAGAEAERLADGSRVITTANSEAVIEFDDGCEVRLKENERYEVDSGRPCALRLAGGLGGAPVALAGPSLVGYVLPVVIPILLLDDSTQQTTPVSPN